MQNISLQKGVPPYSFALGKTIPSFILLHFNYNDSCTACPHTKSMGWDSFLEKPAGFFGVHRVFNAVEGAQNEKVI